jgi:O-antigen/teichoic acid export membrane protein
MDNQDKANKKLASNALSGMVATMIYMVSRLFLTPFILHYLSLAEFGLWSLCFIILSYAGMGGFGVNSTYIRYSARYLAEGKEKEISKLLSTGIAYMLSFSLLFCTLLYLIMPFILNSFHIEKTQQDLASTIFLGTAVVFSLELTLGGFRFIINGIHEFAKERIVTTVAGLIEIMAIIIFLTLGSGVKGLLYAFALRLVLETSSYWKIARTLLPTLTVSNKLISGEHFRLFVGFGGKVQILGILAIFVSAIDRLFINAIAGLSAGGLFEIGRKLPSTAGMISSSVFGPFLSTAAHLDGSWVGNMNDPLSNRIKTYIHIASVTLSLAAIPVLFLPQFQNFLPFSPVLIALFATAIFCFLFFRLQQKQKFYNKIDSRELKELYLNGIRFTNIISSILFVFLIVMAHPLIDAWVGDKYTEASNIMIFLSIGYSIQLSTGPITIIFRGIDRNGRELEYMLVQTLLMVIWIPAATTVWGLTGAAIAIACSSMVSTLFLFWRSNYTFQVGPKEFIFKTLLPVLVTFLPASAIYAISVIFPTTGRVADIVQVLACGTGYVLICLAMFWTIVLNSDEKIKAMELLPFKKQKGSSC